VRVRFRGTGLVKWCAVAMAFCAPLPRRRRS
jgi:hypothetical protein